MRIRCGLSVLKCARFHARLIEACIFALSYVFIYYLYNFSNPIDITYLFVNKWNLKMLQVCHGLMAVNGLFSLLFKASYYLGLSLILTVGNAVLLLNEKYEIFDGVIYAYIVAYSLVFPIFFSFVVYEPLWAGYGHVEDLLLWRGQTLQSTNLFTRPTFTFPSGHVFLSAILAFWYSKTGLRARYLFYGLATLIIVSTVMLGQHWVEDVLAGIAVAVFAYLVARHKFIEYSKIIDAKIACMLAYYKER